MKLVTKLIGGVLALGCGLGLLSVPASSAAPRAPTAPTAPASPAASPQNMRDVMIFDQSTNKLGDCKFIFAKDGAKLVARGGKLVAVCKSPDWHLVFYNAHRNVGISLTYAEMNRRASGIFAGPPYEKGTLSVGFDPKTGLHQMTLNVNGGEEPEGRGDAMIYQVRQKKQFANIRYIVADKVPLDPHVQTFVKWIFSTAQYPGVPMMFESVFTDGTRDLVYKTKTVSRIKLPASEFAYPTGFKPTKKIIDVAVLEDPRETLESLFGGK